MNEKLKKLYAKSDLLMARIEELQAKEILIEAEDLELTQAILDCEKVEGDIDREVKAEKLKEKRKEPENHGWRPKDLQFAPNGITKDFNNIGEQLISVFNAEQSGGRVVDKRLEVLNAAGSNESVPAEGGYLVQEDFITDLMQKTYETGKLTSKCNKLPLTTGANSVKLNGVDESSRKDGYRDGGIRVYSSREAAEMTSSTANKFRPIRLELNDITGLTYITEDLIQDAPMLEAWIMNQFPKAFGFKMDDLLVWGRGAGEPLGWMRSEGRVTIAKESGQDAKTIDVMNVLKMYARFDGLNGIWYHNKNCFVQLATMGLYIGTTFIPLFMPAGGVSGRPYNTLLGLQMVELEQCETLGTEGDLILADYGDYLLIDKGKAQSAVSIHVRFLTNERAFRFIYRCDGQPFRDKPTVPYKGDSTDTLAAFVTIANRA